jgi:dienelactone hydrolase
MDRTAQALADRGLVAATVDYRLSKGSWFPATSLEEHGLREAAARARDDALRAVAWLRSQSARLGFDGRRIVVAGYSAGGIAALEAATHGDAVAGGFAIAGAAVDLAAIDAGDPPLVMAHGATDRIIPLALARATCERAERVGIPCELLVFPAVGHNVVGIESNRLLESLVAFTRRVPPRGAPLVRSSPEGS